MSAHSRHSINNYTDLTFPGSETGPGLDPGSQYCYLDDATTPATLLRHDSGRRDSSVLLNVPLCFSSSPLVLIAIWLAARRVVASHWLSGSLKRSYWDLIGREFNKITTGFCFLSLLKWCWKRLASSVHCGAHKIILKFIEIYYCWCQKHFDNKRKCHNKDQNLQSHSPIEFHP